MHELCTQTFACRAKRCAKSHCRLCLMILAATVPRLRFCALQSVLTGSAAPSTASPLIRPRGSLLLTRQLSAHRIVMNSGTEDSSQDTWKREAPYAPAAADFNVKYTARCMCGAVQYVADSEPVAAKYCHCTSCQRLHGRHAELRCCKGTPFSMGLLSLCLPLQGHHSSGLPCFTRRLCDLPREWTASCSTTVTQRSQSASYHAKLHAPNAIHQ